MVSQVEFLYVEYFYWLVSIPFYKHSWSWAEYFQKFYGNIYMIVPVGRNKLRFPKHFHPFHILGFSPWPISVSISLLTFISGVLGWLAVEAWFLGDLLLGFVSVIICLWCWWGDVIEESLTEHTKRIKRGIAIGMVLFIISEVMFFFSFFWAFFHASLAPGIELGCVWPPKGLEHLVISPYGAPLLNTVILLASGVTVTCVHKAFKIYCYKQRKFANFLNAFGKLGILTSMFFALRVQLGGKGVDKKEKGVWFLFSKDLSYFLMRVVESVHGNFYQLFKGSVLNSNFLICYKYFFLTLVLAVFFTFSQGLEYLESAICISDGVYGATFYMMTGFHGFHVIVGTIFLLVCFLRILAFKYSYVHFIGLECAIWYWHFVDVVWIFLYLFVYIWGNGFISVIDSNIFVQEFGDECIRGDWYYGFSGAQQQSSWVLGLVGSGVYGDFASSYQVDFQDSASFLMEAIVDLHNYIMFYLWVILGLVVWLLIAFSIGNKVSAFRSLVTIVRLVILDVHIRSYISRRLFFIFEENMSFKYPKLSQWSKVNRFYDRFKKVFDRIEQSVIIGRRDKSPYDFAKKADSNKKIKDD